jgi:carbon-monoxide dehydrogenase iron sulfur subunit
MAKRIVLVEDPPLKTCVGCRTCELACSFFHEKVFNPQKSRVQVIREELAISRPILCVQCSDPPCAAACPQGAIVRDEKTGAVIVIEEKCTGCGACVEVCPFGAIWLHPEKRIAIKCDLCGGAPACVKYCPQRVLRYAGDGG